MDLSVIALVIAVIALVPQGLMALYVFWEIWLDSRCPAPSSGGNPWDPPVEVKVSGPTYSREDVLELLDSSNGAISGRELALKELPDEEKKVEARDDYMLIGAYSRYGYLHWVRVPKEAFPAAVSGATPKMVVAGANVIAEEWGICGADIAPALASDVFDAMVREKL